MALYHFVLLLCQSSLLVQNILRDSDLAHIVKQGGLTDNLHHILVHAQGFRQFHGVVSHIVGMAESIVILGVNGSRQSVNRGFIFLIDMSMVLLFLRLHTVLKQGIEYLDPVFAAVLYMVNRQIHVFHQFLH